MSYVETLASIGRIQSRLDELFTPPPAPATAQERVPAADFAGQLKALLGGEGAPLAGGGDVTGADVVAAAEKYLGVPYVFGGTTADGLDCSGLVQRAFADLGVEVPRLVSGQATVGEEVSSLAEARPGDLIVTDGGDHIVIYLGDGMVLHAPYEGRTVSAQKAWFDDAGIVTIRRIVPADPAAAPASSPVLQPLAGGSISLEQIIAAQAMLHARSGAVPAGPGSIEQMLAALRSLA